MISLEPEHKKSKTKRSTLCAPKSAVQTSGWAQIRCENTRRKINKWLFSLSINPTGIFSTNGWSPKCRKMVLNGVCSMEMISSDVLFHPQSKDVQITVRGARTITKLESENFDFLFFKIKRVKPMNLLSKQLTINLITDYSSIDHCSCARSWENSHTNKNCLVSFWHLFLNDLHQLTWKDLRHTLPLLSGAVVHE